MVQIIAGIWKFFLRLLGIRQGTSKAQVDDVIDLLKAEFGSLSLEALQKAQSSFLELAETRFKTLSETGTAQLDQKKSLIDQQLQNMKRELEKVSNLVQTLEKDRETKFGELTAYIKTIGEQTVALTASTSTLREALASSRSRGQWGERMAEDILRLIGFVEGVNYHKQMTVEGGGSRPDFVFLLPQNQKLNMDVKFPLDNYLKYLEAESESDKATYHRDFLRDVRARIAEVSDRQYIDPEQGTVDYVLLFIPNESVYAFIHEADSNILDMALQRKVIWCSPLTLYAVLAVVRQAVDNFALIHTSDEIISLMGSFHEQWKKFTEGMNTLGRRISSVQKEFDSLSGTRRRALERPLSQIEQLRKQRQIPVAEMDDELLVLPLGDENLPVSPWFDLGNEEED